RRTRRPAGAALVEPVGHPELAVVESGMGADPRSPSGSLPGDVRVLAADDSLQPRTGWADGLRRRRLRERPVLRRAAPAADAGTAVYGRRRSPRRRAERTGGGDQLRVVAAAVRGSPDIVGKTQTIDRVPFTIVGVMPPDFFGTDVGSKSDVILPIGTEPLMRGRDSQLNRRTTSWLM